MFPLPKNWYPFVVNSTLTFSLMWFTITELSALLQERIPKIITWLTLKFLHVTYICWTFLIIWPWWNLFSRSFIPTCTIMISGLSSSNVGLIWWFTYELNLHLGKFYGKQSSSFQFSFNFSEVYWFWHAVTYYCHLFILLHCFTVCSSTRFNLKYHVSFCIFVYYWKWPPFFFLSLSFFSVPCFM